MTLVEEGIRINAYSGRRTVLPSIFYIISTYYAHILVNGCIDVNYWYDVIR